MDSLYSWISFLLFGGLLAYFASTFKTYQKAVESHQKLTDILNDPKVRVASGDHASTIIQAAQDTKEVIEDNSDLEIKADSNRFKLLQQLYKEQTTKD